MNIYENKTIKRKIKGEYLQNYLYLSYVLSYKTIDLINALTWYFEVIKIYASNIICIFMNTIEDIRNKTNTI